MRVGRYFLVCISIVSLVALAGAAAIVAFEFSRYEDAVTAERSTLALGSTMKIGENVLLERGVHNQYLVAEAAVADAAVQQMRKASSDTDAAIADAARRVESIGDGSAALQQQLRSVASSLADLRKLSFEESAKPKAQRAADAATRYFTKAAEIIDAADRVASAVERNVSRADPVVGQIAMIARISAEMRDGAGRKATTLVQAVASRTPIAPAVLETLADFDGRVAASWRRILYAVGQVDPSPVLSGAVETVTRQYLGEGKQLYTDIYAAGRSTGAYPLTMEAFRGKQTPLLQSILVVRDAAIEQALLTARDRAERAMRELSLAVAWVALVVVLVVLATWAFRRRVVGPMGALTRAVTEVAAGDLAVEVPARNRRDEVGEMAAAIEVLRMAGVEARQVAAVIEKAQADRAARVQAIEQLAARFEMDIGATIAAAHAAAEGMRHEAQSTATLARDIAGQARMVAEASDQGSRNVETVATAAEELSASVGEIGQQVARSSAVTSQAVDQARDASARVDGLSEASGKIGAVIQLISEIASQTNLLALNATIEAARAGEAGKGFAVVANEVKSLATQTAKATEDITGQIARIQQASTEVAQTIGGIVTTIGEVNEIAGSIAAAVEQQAAATSEIARNVNEAATGMRGVSSNVGAVTEAIASTSQATDALLGGIDTLSGESRTLSARIQDFLAAVKAA